MSRLPAEWEKQSGVQLTWPHCETEWYELLRFEPLMIVTRDIEECKDDIARISQAKGLQIDVDAIKFYECPLNDTWARDHGGISVFGEDGQKYLYDFVFNGWGLKFGSDLDNQITRNIFFQNAFHDDVLCVDMRPYVLEGGSIDSDGCGTMLTTTECLCSVNRNEYLSQEEINDELCGAFGLERILWLDHGTIIGDDTDSHVSALQIRLRICSVQILRTLTISLSERWRISFADSRPWTASLTISFRFRFRNRFILTTTDFLRHMLTS